MFPALLLLALFVLGSPLFLIFDGPIVYGAVAAITAVLVAIVGLRIRPGEAGFLSSLILSVAIVAAIPALVIGIQLIPLSGTGLANPIWKSAAAALSRPTLGSITVDPGATLITLLRYISVVALAFVAAAVAIDRNRAYWLLCALTTASTFVALMVLATSPGGLKLLNTGDSATLTAAASDHAGLGVIFAIAAALSTRDRANTPSSNQEKSQSSRFLFVMCWLAIVVCSLAVFTSATTGVYFALACGVATLIVATVMRRFRFDVWGYLAIISIAVIIGVAVLALRPNERMVDLTVAFANSPQAPMVVLTQRILAETSWLGTGAGTFAAILPIYRDIGELTAGNTAPTAAAAIAIEMGRPFLWISVVGGIALAMMLLRSSASRGRDSFYSAAGASCVIAVTILLFNNDGVLGTSILMIVAVAIGIALAQSKSRSV
jgi:hypothetical protein